MGRHRREQSTPRPLPTAMVSGKMTSSFEEALRGMRSTGTWEPTNAQASALCHKPAISAAATQDPDKAEATRKNGGSDDTQPPGSPLSD